LIPHLKTGDQVDVRIDALGRQSFSGRILRIHPTLDAFTRQGIVEILLDPVPTGSRAGQFSRVILHTAAVKRIFVPFRALKRNREFEYVYLLDGDNRARQTQVRSGLQIGRRVEIVEGVEAGQQIIVKGFLGLKEGLAVKLTTEARRS
jgi:membrane fusion protein (multidrug efflux system)